MDRMLEGLRLLLWTATWVAGGILLAASLFRLRRGETAMVGLGLGLVLQAWLANLCAQFVPVPYSFWIAPAALLAAGLLLALGSGKRLKIDVSLPHWALLLGLTMLFYAIGRGLGIFDDYQNLPTVSLLAAGDVPPHFALDPALKFGYHYLLLLFAAEIMRVGNMLPWSALDLARGVMLALPLLLAGIWAYRLTRRGVPAFLTSCMLAFAGGARWLLLLFPAGWMTSLSQHTTLIGSAASSAPNLAAAMISIWKIDGAGPIAFPFAFHSGVNQSYVMAHTGIAGSGIMILLLLLLTSSRWRGGGAAVVSAALLAALAVANEIAFLLLGLGLLLAGLAWLAAGRKPAEAKNLLIWIAVAAAAVLLAALQGGMLTEMLYARLRHSAAYSTYFDASPALVWPPAVVSAHLGSLSLADPWQVIAAVLEIGPVVLVSPLVFLWGARSLRLGKWFETSLIASSAGALLAAFISFRGPLFTAGPRLMGGWFLVCTIYFVPLLWIWCRSRGEGLRIGALSVAFTSCLGGLILFGIQLAAIQQPVFATFISQMDAKMADEHWNELPSGALVFDPLVFRAPTVFGRATKSSPSWYSTSSDWEHLKRAANPYELRRAGFDYMYLDADYWEQLSPEQQASLGGPCIQQLWQVEGVHSETDYTKDFRRLLDIRSCR